MDLETFIITVFCLVDDFVRGLFRGCRLRRRGPAPVLADSEVLAIEAVGEFLGLDTDRALHAHFRRHFGHLFPGLRAVHRTTFLRQAANLWAVKQALWQRLAAATRRGGKRSRRRNEKARMPRQHPSHAFCPKGGGAGKVS